MPARKRHRAGVGMVYPDAIFMRLEGSARVGWAKWYEEVRRTRQLEHANEVLIDRIETLVPHLLELTDDVLFERNIKAFHSAYQIRSLIEDYLRGARNSA